MLARRRFGMGLAAAVGGMAAMLFAAVPNAIAQEKVTVFAAASLKNALDAVNAACEAAVGEQATVSDAASSALAKQIEECAPADASISADLDWMKYLSDKKLTKPETEVKLLGNKIVLVAPADSKAEAKIEKGFDLAALIGDGKLAMGDVKAVPAGKYGKAALELLGVWPSVEGKVAQAENVRAALKFVSTGEAREPINVVVLGGGYAGVLAANHLRVNADVAITLINPRPEFVERIRLHQFITGSDYAVVNYADVLSDDVRLLVDTAELIDAASRTVTLGSGDTIGYDYLIYAVGSTGAALTVPGAAEFAHPISELESTPRRQPWPRFTPAHRWWSSARGRRASRSPPSREQRAADAGVRRRPRPVLQRVGAPVGVEGAANRVCRMKPLVELPHDLPDIRDRGDCATSSCAKIIPAFIDRRSFQAPVELGFQAQKNLRTSQDTPIFSAWYKRSYPVHACGGT